MEHEAANVGGEWEGENKTKIDTVGNKHQKWITDALSGRSRNCNRERGEMDGMSNVVVGGGWTRGRRGSG